MLKSEYLFVKLTPEWILYATSLSKMPVKNPCGKVAWRALKTIGLQGFLMRAYEQCVIYQRMNISKDEYIKG